MTDTFVDNASLRYTHVKYYSSIWDNTNIIFRPTGSLLELLTLLRKLVHIDKYNCNFFYINDENYVFDIWYNDNLYIIHKSPSGEEEVFKSLNSMQENGIIMGTKKDMEIPQTIINDLTWKLI
jgi:hypothetical protein